MIGAIIQARMGSTRLPGKVLMEICGEPVLGHVLNRVSRSRLVDKVIVATTTNPEDVAIEQFCLSRNIPVYRGSPDDVLDRYYQCAKIHSLDTVVRITSDCPLQDPSVIDRVVAEYKKGGNDYVTNTFEYTYPDGLDVEVFSTSSLNEAWIRATLGSDREHVTPFIRKNPSLNKKNVLATKKYPQYRLTLDTPDDYNFIRRIFEGLNCRESSLDEVIDFLNHNPSLNSINANAGINEGYIKSLIDDAKTTVIETDRLFLRHLMPDDASDRYISWLNDPVVNQFLETKSVTKDELKKFIQERKENPYCLFWGIFLKKDGQHIGNVKLEPIDLKSREATIGILIGERNWWGKGICTEVITRVVNYIFYDMHISSLHLGVISDNQNAIDCYRKAGFTITKKEPLYGVNATTERVKIIMTIQKTKPEGEL